MNKVLTHLRILRPFQNPEYIENGWIRIIDSRIAAFGKMPVKLDEDEFEINMGNKLVIPGMINAHTHLYSALAMGMPAPKHSPQNFVQILEEVWWKLDRALDAETTLASFQAGLLACLQAGVTTVFDHHSSPNFTKGSLKLLAETAHDFGIKVSTAFEVTDRNGPTFFQSGIEENLHAISEFKSNPAIHPMLGLHASFTLSDESLEMIRKVLEKHSDVGIHIHIAEDIADHHDSGARGYQSVVQRLSEYDLIHSNSLYAHGIHITPDDADVLFNAGANLVHNPSSNANNRVGILNGVTLEALGFGLGTDGMQANMLSEAKEGTLIRAGRLSGSAPNVDYIKLLFQNNPQIAGKLFGSPLGRIEPGTAADLAFYNYQPRTEFTAENWSAHLLFGLDLPCSVMTDGEFRLMDNEVVGMNEADILTNAQQASRRLWDAMEKMN